MRPISIWQPQRRGGDVVFVRPEPLALGDHYAARREIPVAKAEGVRRVCFFGESVAAGYLYAPHLTPAGVLEAQLRVLGGSHEVVDLARTNETLAGLVETVTAAGQLAPDALVIFVGNNWNLLETPEVSPYFPSREDRRVYARLVREAGWAGPLEVAGRRRLERVGVALEAVAAVAGSCPVVVVVPEVNLADWESRQPVLWLPGDGATRWHGLLFEAVSASSAGRWEDARRAAMQMLDLDDGTCPTPFRILANAFRAAGDELVARRAAEAEVAADAYAVMAGLGAPRAAALDQEVLRRGAARHGFRLVDLPRLFANHTGTALPGRRMFLDYCHLTAEGIRVAMAGVAAALLDRRVGDVLSDVPALVVPRDVEATARLGAAVHTAHRHLPVDRRTDLVRHWLAAALEASPGVEHAMRDLVTARLAPLPEVLTTAQVRNFASPHPLGFQHGWRFPHADADLIAAIGSVLVAAGRPPLDIGAGPPGELLPYWLSRPLERFFPDTMDFADHTHRAYHRSPWQATRLAFPCSAGKPVRVRVTARLPAGRRGRIAIDAVGHPLGHAEVGPDWTTHEFFLTETNALNQLTVGWPALDGNGDEMLAAALDRLDAGLAADLHPVFGELYSVRADPA